MDNNLKKSSLLNYPQNIEEKLGFDKIREFIQAECTTNAAKNALNKLSFSSDFKRIQHSIKTIQELNNLNSRGIYFQFPEDPERNNDDISRSDIEGIMLFEDELFDLLKAFLHLEHNFKTCKSEIEFIPELKNQQNDLISLQTAIGLLDSVLDKEGKIKPNASAALWDIQKKINQKEKDVRRILHSRFEMARKNGWAGDTEITIRNERLVIPIIAEFKKKMPGFVHDDSQSGKFLYIEPIECFEENNLLKELYLDKKKEIETILRQTTFQLSTHKDNIKRHLQFSIYLDTLTAKSVFSSKLRSTEPLYVKKHDDCDLIDARHPLLYLLMSKNNKNAVPLNFHFKKGNYMVLVSGPNAGGKSIALKTIGLLQYMYQCGLPIPAAADSKLSIYKQLFIDIGDNQSIENNLSSYSSHLLNMKYFMENANDNTLYLIDELGNGTDPAIGSTIAQAILELLLSKKAIGIVTTHFGNLKAWASNTDGVQNARMLYDLNKLEPLFILEPDKAGSSFALEVASKVGIAPELLQRARNISRFKQEIDLDELLAENEKHKKELSDNKHRMLEREKVLERLISEYESLKTSLSDNRTHILNEAKTKAGDLLNKANQKIEQTIRDIKQNEAKKEKTKEIRSALDEFKKEIVVMPLKELVQPTLKASQKPKSTELKAGSIVRHPEYKVSGEILQTKKNQAQVLFGQIKLWLPLDELNNSIADKKHVPQTAVFNVDQFNKQTNFRAEIDLRGIRGEEAIEQLDEWLHDAHMLGMLTLRIIHGRGHGILRKLIFSHLKTKSFVESFEHETEQLGGDGVTLVKIK
jgi:DNA mismatch repair protein MutS2